MAQINSTTNTIKADFLDIPTRELWYKKLNEYSKEQKLVMGLAFNYPELITQN